MPDHSPDDQPKFVTDEPGRDPVSGRPWGEETPGKRVASYSLLTVIFAVGCVYLLVSGLGSDGRGQIAIVVCPLAAILFALRTRHAIKEYRTSSDAP